MCNLVKLYSPASLARSCHREGKEMSLAYAYEERGNKGKREGGGEKSKDRDIILVICALSVERNGLCMCCVCCVCVCVYMYMYIYIYIYIWNLPMRGRYLYSVPIMGKDLGPGISSKDLGLLASTRPRIVEHDRRAYNFSIVARSAYRFTRAYMACTVYRGIRERYFHRTEKPSPPNCALWRLPGMAMETATCAQGKQVWSNDIDYLCGVSVSRSLTLFRLVFRSFAWNHWHKFDARKIKPAYRCPCVRHAVAKGTRARTDADCVVMYWSLLLASRYPSIRSTVHSTVHSTRERNFRNDPETIPRRG